MSRPQTADAQAYMAHMTHVLSVIGSPDYPPDPQRLQQRAMASYSRAYRPAGTARQLVAVAADGDRSPLLHRIVAPTRVIHGEADPLVPVPAAHDLVQQDPRRGGRHRARHGPRPAAAAAAAHRRGHRCERRAQRELKRTQALARRRRTSHLRSSSAHSTPLASSSSGPSTWPGSGTVWNSAFIGGA